MPIVAATLQEAIANTNGQAGTAPLVAGRALFYISTFNSVVPTTGWPANFDPNNAAQRTVRNWIVQGKLVQDQTPAGVTNAQQTQNVVNAACRVMYAAQAAAAAGRISAAQEAAVLTAWNNSFGSVP